MEHENHRQHQMLILKILSKCVYVHVYREREREAPDIAPIEGDPEARDQLHVQTVFMKHKIYKTLKTRYHKEFEIAFS